MKTERPLFFFISRASRVVFVPLYHLAQWRYSLDIHVVVLIALIIIVVAIIIIVIGLNTVKDVADVRPLMTIPEVKVTTLFKLLKILSSRDLKRKEYFHVV